LSKYLVAKDLVPTHETTDGTFKFVGIQSKNREEWVIADYACILANITSITLYDTFGTNAIEFILHQTNLNTIFASNDKVKTLLESKKNNKDLTSFKTIIHFDGEASDELKTLSAEVGIVLTSF
jgi:long-chain acyl-CoA synthetase